MFLCLFSNLSPVCTMRCSKAEKNNHPTCLLIDFNSAFYIGKFDFFFDITVVYIKKNHLLRNLFFYASAVNVHIVAV